MTVRNFSSIIIVIYCDIDLIMLKEFLCVLIVLDFVKSGSNTDVEELNKLRNAIRARMEEIKQELDEELRREEIMETLEEIGSAMTCQIIGC